MLKAPRNRERGAIVPLLGALGVLAGLAGSAAANPPPTVSTEPSLFPTFNVSVSDYVVRCQPSNEVQVSVSTPQNVKASVDGGPWSKGSFSQAVSLSAGESFDITFLKIKSGVETTYFIRCLPSDFPTFAATRDGPTQAKWYAVTPSLGSAPPGESQQYVAFFDRNGVPMWWMSSAGSTIPLDAKLLPNGNVAWLHFNPGASPTGAEEHQLDGSLIRSLDTVPSGADHHDLQLLPNGDYLMGRTFKQSPVDMSSCGGSTDGTLQDFELQELSPNGALVWSWLASEHIPFTEVTARWQRQCTSSGDIYHWNSVEPDGDGYVLSFRHLDAVYRIDRGTGAIDWKLGGVSRPESLTVVGDPLSAVSTFCGQHDARVRADGRLTVFDDGTGCNRPSRAVRFAIDQTAAPPTATLRKDLRDSNGASSGCCGSARRLPGHNWVVQWGNNSYLTEQTGAGVPVFQLSFTPGVFTYRAYPVLRADLSRAALRAGMNAQYPRP